MNLFLMCGRCSTTENRDGVCMSLCVFVLLSVCSVITRFCVCLRFLYVHVTVMQLHIVYTLTCVHVRMQVCLCLSLRALAFFEITPENMTKTARLDSDLNILVNVVFLLNIIHYENALFSNFSLTHHKAIKVCIA